MDHKKAKVTIECGEIKTDFHFINQGNVVSCSITDIPNVSNMPVLYNFLFNALIDGIKKDSTLESCE